MRTLCLSKIPDETYEHMLILRRKLADELICAKQAREDGVVRREACVRRVRRDNWRRQIRSLILFLNPHTTISEHNRNPICRIFLQDIFVCSVCETLHSEDDPALQVCQSRTASPCLWRPEEERRSCPRQSSRLFACAFFRLTTYVATRRWSKSRVVHLRLMGTSRLNMSYGDICLVVCIGKACRRA